MLSLFPSLLTYGLFGPLFLRLTLGIILVHWSYRKFKEKGDSKKVTLGILEGVLGILFILGLFTQLAALIAALLFLIHIVIKIKHRRFLTDGINYYFILFIMALSLLFLGAGFFAFDLPL